MKNLALKLLHKNAIMFFAAMLVFVSILTLPLTASAAYAYGAYSTTNQTGGTPSTWYYYLSGNNAILVDSTSLSGDVVLPSKLDGHPVTSCEYYDGGNYHYYDVLRGSAPNVTSVTIPDSFTSIGPGAFQNQKGLLSVSIPDTVKTIGTLAFGNCTSLTSFTIPSAVTTIANSAFSGCTGLTSIIIPDTVLSLGTGLFMGCTGLKSVNMPDSWTVIPSGMFSSCSGLTSVTLPSNLKTISENAFISCRGMTTINIPSTVKTIGKSAFSGCPGSATNKIIIPKNIGFIGDYAFSDTRGVYYFSSSTVATNAANKYKTSSYPWTIMSDSAEPTVPSITVVPKTNTITIISGTDTNSGVENTLYQINGGTWTVYNTPVVVSDGTYTITAKTIDRAGNVSSIVTTTFTAYQSAQTAINQALASLSQMDIDSAQALISAISDAATKSALQSQLDLAQFQKDGMSDADNTINYINLTNNDTSGQPDTANTVAGSASSISTTVTDLEDVIYANNLYVAIGSDGGILTSTDAESWAPQMSGTTSYLEGITYGGGKFVAVGKNGTVVTSTNGTAWNVQTSGVTCVLNDIAYGGGSFVAVGAKGTVLTSSDGILWTKYTSGSTYSILGIAFGNGKFVAVDAVGNVYNSTNGTAWTIASLGSSYGAYDIAYGNGLFVAVAHFGKIYTSSDGVNWAPQNSGTSSYLCAVTYGDNRFVAVGSGGKIIMSLDTVTWVVVDSGVNIVLYGVASGDGRCIAVGGSSIVVVGGVDLVAPTLTLTSNPSGATNGVVTVTATATDTDAIVLKYAEGAQAADYFTTMGTIFSTSFNVIFNGTFTVCATDTSGNATVKTITINNIDVDAPALSLSANPDTDKAESVEITATTNDASSVITKYAAGTQDAAYFTGAGTVFTGKFTVTANDIYTVYAIDAAGNSTVQTIGVSNIADLTAPTVSLTANPTVPTEGKVTITATITDKSLVTTKFAEGAQNTSYFETSGTAFINSFDVTKNNKYTVYAVDAAGNETITTIDIENIGADISAPVITLTADPTTTTNDIVTITAVVTDNDSVTTKYASGAQNAAYFKSAGTDFTNSFTVDVNSAYTVYAEDGSGNGSVKTIIVNNIDTVAPVVTLSATPATENAESVKITATVQDASTYILKYAEGEQAINYFDNSGNAFAGSFNATKNDIYTVYAVDTAGNGSVVTITVSNIVSDATPPVIALSQNPTIRTTLPVTITAVVTDKNTVTTKYAKGKVDASYFASAGTSFTNSFTVSENGSYTVYAIDSKGNASTAQITIANIIVVDNSPQITLSTNPSSATKEPVTVTATVVDDSACATKYAEGSHIASYFADAGTTFTDTFVVMQNGTYSVYAKDADGNESVKTITISNIDTTPPTLFLSANPATGDTEQVTITVTVSGESKYTVKGAPGEQSASYFQNAGTQVIGSFIVSENGTYTVYAVDAAGNYAIQTIDVSNIINITSFTLSVSTTLPTAGSVVVSLTANEPGLITTKYAEGYVGKQYFSDSGIAFDNSFVVTQNGTYTVCLTNSSGVSTVKTVTISNIDNAEPTTPVITAVGETNTFTITASDNYSGVSSIMYALDDGPWVVYTGPVTVEDGDYTIYAKAVDGVGNESEMSDVSMTAYKTALSIATIAVIKTETTFLQADVDAAYIFVNGLPDGKPKEDLLHRLSIIQALLDNTPIPDDDIDDIEDEVNALMDGDLKDILLERLAGFGEYNDALAAVVLAETTLLQNNVDAAYVLVNALVDGVNKQGLVDRLVAVEAQITAIQAATAAVVTAETSKSQADVDIARTLVDVLNPSAAKTDLAHRLDVIQTEIDTNAQSLALSTAQAAVEAAEISKLQSDVDTALVLVNALFDSAGKASLLDRLAIVQAEIDAINNATTAVEMAENSKAQADVDTARGLVSVLANNETKTALTARLDAVQQYIDDEKAYAQQLAIAEAAVVTAEASKTQNDVDSASVLVNGLRENDKTALLARLKAVQDYINAEAAYANQLSIAVAAVVTAEISKAQSDVTAAYPLVNNLRNADKTALIARLEAVQAYIDAEDAYAIQLATAVAAVVNSENVKTQPSVDSATTLVNALREADKPALLARLAVVQNAIDIAYASQVVAATSAVVTAEATKKQTDVDSASTLVNALKDSTVKTDLLARLAVVQGIIDTQSSIDKINEAAIAAVEKAEASLLQADVNAASVLVSALADDTLKSSLQPRLDAVQQYITARAAVITAEKYKQTYYTDKAYVLVKALPDSARKTALILRLEAVQYGVSVSVFEAAIAAVEKAEASELQVDIDSAWVLVNPLSDGSITKTDLVNRLNALALKIGAKTNPAIAAALKAVEIAESTMLKTDFVVARGLVDALPDSASKTVLDMRLDAIEALVNAIYAVSYAESSMSMETYLAAKTLVDALPVSDTKTALQARLATLLTALYGNNASTAVAKAITAVDKAEKYVTLSYYKSANTLVEALVDSAVKTWLQERLMVVYYKLYPSADQAAINTATAAVINAEKYKSEYYILKAHKLVVALSESSAKTALMTRVNAVLDLLIAQDTQLVVTAETNLTATSYNSALSAVNKLPDCDEKTMLLERLDAVQATITGNNITATLEEATTYVGKAEYYVSDYYYNKALGMTNSLADSAEKTALLARLAVVKINLEAKNLATATTAVGWAEKYKTTYYINSAMTKVNKLPNSTEKTSLQARITVVQAMIAVEAAEASTAQVDIDKATALVNVLADSTVKTELQTRLNAVIVV